MSNATDISLKEYVQQQLAVFSRGQEQTLDRQQQGWVVLQGMLEQVDKQSIERFSHMERIASLMSQNIDTRFSGIDKATDLASSALDKRLDGMNEIRAQMKDQSDKFHTKAEYIVAHMALETAVSRIVDRINVLEQANANLQGRMWAIGIAITLFSVATSIAIHFIH